MRLAELQAGFLRGVSEPAASEAAPDYFQAPPAASVATRFGVYRRAYFLRLVEAIQGDFPAVARILGPLAFRDLIARYLEASPPSSHDISRAGDGLPRFLETDRQSVELPFLPDLARFESEISRAAVAANHAPIGRHDLAALGDELFDHPISLAPGAALLVSDWPLAALWQLQHASDDEIALQVDGRPSRTLIHREGLEVRWRAVTDLEAAFLAAAERGATLTQIVDTGALGSGDAPGEAISLLIALCEGNAVSL